LITSGPQVKNLR